MSVLYLRTNLQHAATVFIPLEETVVVALGLPCSALNESFSAAVGGTVKLSRLRLMRRIF